jgi:tetratricopeptide (TPR) repeat protein
MGRAFCGQNKTIQAIPYYGKAVHLDPKLGFVHTLLGSAFSQLRHFDIAIQYFKKALELNPNDFESKDGISTSSSLLKFIITLK